MGNCRATRLAYGETLAEIGAEQDNLVVMDSDLSKSTMTSIFAKKFPERFFNTGIAEGNMMSVAAGLATCGKVVFASTFAVFAAGRAFEQIRNSVAYSNLSVKVAATHAGISVGEDGASHQMNEDIALMRSLPNMTVISPADYNEAASAVRLISKHDGPAYLRLGRLPVPDIFPNDYEMEIGKGVVLKEGSDVAVISTGLMVHESLKAVKLLEEKGVRAKLINIHTIKPIDKELIVSAAEKARAIVTVEEHSIYGGLGSAVAEVVCQHCPVRMKFIGMNDVFGRSGKPKDLFKFYSLDSDSIANLIYDFLNNI